MTTVQEHEIDRWQKDLLPTNQTPKRPTKILICSFQNQISQSQVTSIISSPRVFPYLNKDKGDIVLNKNL